jgi:hypothetical protein
MQSVSVCLAVFNVALRCHGYALVAFPRYDSHVPDLGQWSDAVCSVGLSVFNVALRCHGYALVAFPRFEYHVPD